MELTRRQVLRRLGAAARLAALPGCGTPFAGVRLRIATGSTAGEYFRLGRALAAVWQERLHLTSRPRCCPPTAPRRTCPCWSPARRRSRSASSTWPPTGRRAARRCARWPRSTTTPCRSSSPRARRSAPWPTCAAPACRSGPENSGVAYVALRVLAAAGLAGQNDVRRARLDLAGSVAALRAGDVDAFFWVGALPTRTVDELAAAVPVRLLDLEPVLDALRARYPVYTPGTVLAGPTGSTTRSSRCWCATSCWWTPTSTPPGRGDDRRGVRRAAAAGRRDAGGAHRRRPLGHPHPAGRRCTTARCAGSPTTRWPDRPHPTRAAPRAASPGLIPRSRISGRCRAAPRRPRRTSGRSPRRRTRPRAR